MTNARDRSLDGLRGLAALAVVLSHIAAMTWIPFIENTPGLLWQRTLWSLGAPAVDIFLVLSGYVVAGSIVRRNDGYPSYILGRLIRLMPIAWLAIAAGVALRAAGLFAPDGTTAGLQALHAPLTNMDVMGFATMAIPIPDVEKINPPLWTLVIEMQAAYLMPLVAWMGRRRPVALAIAGPLALVAFGLAINYSYPVLLTGFILGACFAGIEDRLARPPRILPILILSIALLMARAILQSDDQLLRVPCALGALGVMYCVRQDIGRRTLESPIVQWLGRISYPLYAIHWPIMAGCVMTLGWWIGPIAASLISVPMALALAHVAEVAIDRRAVALSRLVRG